MNNCDTTAVVPPSGSPPPSKFCLHSLNYNRPHLQTIILFIRWCVIHHCLSFTECVIHHCHISLPYACVSKKIPASESLTPSLCAFLHFNDMDLSGATDILKALVQLCSLTSTLSFTLIATPTQTQQKSLTPPTPASMPVCTSFSLVTSSKLINHPSCPLVTPAAYSGSAEEWSVFLLQCSFPYKDQKSH